MKAKIIAVVFVSLFVLTQQAFAHPPSSIELTYDLDSKTLTVATKHISQQLEKDYLKKMVFYINGEEAATEYFQRQYKKSEFTAEVALDAKEGDEISVEITSSEGGTKSASLTVEGPAEEEGEKAQK